MPAPGAPRLAEAERDTGVTRRDLEAAVADLELPAEGRLDEPGCCVRRRPDEGPVQRRTKLPRQEDRCVVCPRAAESGELGDGERGGEKERSGDCEEQTSPVPRRGRALGFRRAPVRPQVREARHVFSIHARIARGSDGGIGLLERTPERFAVKTGGDSPRITLQGYAKLHLSAAVLPRLGGRARGRPARPKARLEA